MGRPAKERSCLSGGSPRRRKRHGKYNTTSSAAGEPAGESASARATDRHADSSASAENWPRGTHLLGAEDSAASDKSTSATASVSDRERIFEVNAVTSGRQSEAARDGRSRAGVRAGSCSGHHHVCPVSGQHARHIPRRHSATSQRICPPVWRSMCVGHPSQSTEKAPDASLPESSTWIIRAPRGARRRSASRAEGRRAGGTHPEVISRHRGKESGSRGRSSGGHS